ncbi:MAG: transcription elongation factor GreA [Rickettsiales bacterium]|nr:transcription elongation factor GreA [Rickettsiales bacterium]
MKRFPITKEGFEKLSNELKQLKVVERPAVIAAISEAREHGDLSENAEYQAAKEKQGFVESRIIELEDKLARSEVIDVSKLSGDTVKFGAYVNLIDLDTNKKIAYQIVGDYESELAEEKVSLNSPIARAMVGKNKGEIIEVGAPSGIKEYKILEVNFS